MGKFLGGMVSASSSCWRMRRLHSSIAPRRWAWRLCWAKIELNAPMMAAAIRASMATAQTVSMNVSPRRTGRLKLWVRADSTAVLLPVWRRGLVFHGPDVDVVFVAHDLVGAGGAQDKGLLGAGAARVVDE